jgi:predicted AlkP superfamily phosphohydrolase/phosphomutase
VNVRPLPLSRAILEGLGGGAAAGACLLLLERSRTFNVFADILNATFRHLHRVLPEATVVHLDVESVALVGYVGGHGLLGAGCGLFLGIGGSRGGALAGSWRRAFWLSAVLFAIDSLLFGSVWRHRVLPLDVGFILVGLASLAAFATARVSGALVASLLPARLVRTLAVALPLLVLAGGGAVILSAARGPTRPPSRGVESPTRVETGLNVALLGVDGIEWDLIRQGIAEGRLPHFAELIANGVSGDLRSLRPPKSPVVWTSLVTGVLPSVHGITDFVVHRNRQAIPVTSNMRRVPALWNIADTAGFDVAFVNWYVTWPAEEVPGILVSDRVDFDGLPERVHPPEMIAAVDSLRRALADPHEQWLARLLDRDEGSVLWQADRWGESRRALKVVTDVVRHDLVTLETSRLALAKGQPDLTAVYFRGNDNTQHLFWKHRLAKRRGLTLARALYGEISEQELGYLGPLIDRYYDLIDEVLGETISLLDRDTVIFVLSDHGFIAHRKRNRWYHVNRLLEAAGLAVLIPGSGGDADSTASIVWSPDGPTTSPVCRLRAAGAATAAETALERARAVLTASETDAGEPLFSRVDVRVDEEGAFLEAEFVPAPSGANVRVADVEISLADVHAWAGKSGDHGMNGVLIAAGPPIKRGERVHGARALDIAPTVLHLLGIPVARDMEGIVLTEILRGEWAQDHELRSVASYGQRDATGEDAISSDVDEKIRDELRALGYID